MVYDRGGTVSADSTWQWGGSRRREADAAVHYQFAPGQCADHIFLSNARGCCEIRVLLLYEAWEYTYPSCPNAKRGWRIIDVSCHEEYGLYFVAWWMIKVCLNTTYLRENRKHLSDIPDVDRTPRDPLRRAPFKRSAIPLTKEYKGSWCAWMIQVPGLPKIRHWICTIWNYLNEPDVADWKNVHGVANCCLYDMKDLWPPSEWQHKSESCSNICERGEIHLVFVTGRCIGTKTSEKITDPGSVVYTVV